MKRWSWVCIAVALTIVCSKPIEVQALAGTYHTSAAHSLNNDLVSIDYKLSESEQQDIIDQLQYSFLSKADLDESVKYLNTSIDRDIDLSSYEHSGAENKSVLNDQAIAKAYLIKNNILERRGSIKFTGGINPFTFERCEDEYSVLWEEQFIDKGENLKEHIEQGEFGKAGTIELLDAFVEECAEILRTVISEEPEENAIYQTLISYKNKVKYAINNVSGKQKRRETAVELIDEITEYAKSFKIFYAFRDTDIVTKSELLMLLSKASFGIQPSRTVVWNAPSIRNGSTYSQCTKDYWNDGKIVSSISGYWDTGQFKGSASFEMGDFYYYTSSNVYELYWKDLLDRGLIFLDEFGDDSEATKFVEEYENYTEELPNWATSLGACSVGLDRSLGSGYFFGETNYNLSMICKHPQYFSDETLTTMEIYQYVEDFLRVTEKDISETEAEIIAYKFGLNYLAPYSGSQLKTLQFLIAKGILNFEDSSEFYNLDAMMSYSRLYQLLYRVANTDARYNFSQIQLTDSESYWADKGYAESNVEIVNSSTGFVSSNTKPERVEEVADSGWSFFDTVYADKQTYNIVYKLTKTLQWSYDGISLENMSTGGNLPETVSSVESSKIKYNGKQEDVWKLVLQVPAQSANKAIRYAENRLMTDSINGDGVSTLVKVSSQGKSEDAEEYSLISQKALKQTFSNISVLEDKVLVNNDTGCQAILFPDLGYALVGNTVVRTNGFIAEEAGDEVYYNLKVIMSLLDDSFMKKTGIKLTIFNCSKKFKSKYVNVSSEYDQAFTKAAGTILIANKKMLQESLEYSSGDEIVYYKVDDMNDGLNTLVRKFSVSGRGTMYLIVDFELVIPDVEDFATDSEMEKALQALREKKDVTTELTQSEILKAFYTRATGSKVLEAWWDSNYVASNALVNFMLGTKGVEYITTGYLTPSITILGPSKGFGENAVEWTSDLFKGIEFRAYGDMKATDVGGYVNGGTSTWFQYFFNPDTAFAGSDLTDEQSSILSRLVTNTRKCAFLSGKKIEKYGGTSFGMQFFLTNAGVLYRNAASDLRVTATKQDGEIKSFQLKTRLPQNIDLEANVTEVVSFASSKKPKMLYRGKAKLGEKTYYVLTPVENVVRLDPEDPLYNGAFLAVDHGAADIGSLSLVIDRGTWKSASSTETGNDSAITVKQGGSPNIISDGDKTTDLPSEHRYVAASDVFNLWATEYLGESVSYCSYSSDSSDPSSPALPLGIWCTFNAKMQKKVGGLDRYLFVCGSDKAPSKLESTELSTEFFEEFQTAASAYFNGVKTQYKGIAANTAGTHQWLNLPCVRNDESSWELSQYVGFSMADMHKAGDLDKTHYNVADSTSNNTFDKSSFKDSIFITGISDRFCQTKNVVTSGDAEDKTVDPNAVAIAVPNFYVPVSDYVISSGKDDVAKLKEGSCVCEAFCMSNLYGAGILKSVQESIIAEYVETTSLGNLDSGDIIAIEGVRYYVDKGQDRDSDGFANEVWMTSSILNIRESNSERKSLVKSAKKWKSSKVSTQLSFIENALSLIADTIIQCDGKAYPLSGYLVGGVKNYTTKEGETVNYPAGVEPGRKKVTPATKQNGLVYLSGTGKIMGYKKVGSKNKTDRPINSNNSSNYKYVRVRFCFDGNLKVRPLNDVKTQWTLTNTTISGNVGGSGDFFFYDEELNYDTNLYADVSTQSTLFNPSAAFLAVKSQFEKTYQQLFMKDLKTWILMIICCIAIYICVISWIAYLVLHYGVMHQLFTIIDTGPANSNGTGFDVVSFFTLKMFTLNDDPPLHQVIIIQFLCVCIASLCFSIV